MREILFRAKRLDNGAWVTGVPLRYDGYYYAMLYQSSQNRDFERKEINIKTLGQYTGLTDNYFEKIFEGDIVALKDEEVYFAIQWNNKTAKFECVYSGYSIDFDNIDIWDVEVIGNIYDNPELMKAKKHV